MSCDCSIICNTITETTASLAVDQDFATEEDIPLLTSFMDKGYDDDNIEITMATANVILSFDSQGR